MVRSHGLWSRQGRACSCRPRKHSDQKSSVLESPTGFEEEWRSHRPGATDRLKTSESATQVAGDPALRDSYVATVRRRRGPDSSVLQAGAATYAGKEPSDEQRAIARMNWVVCIPRVGGRLTRRSGPARWSSWLCQRGLAPVRAIVQSDGHRGIYRRCVKRSRGAGAFWGAANGGRSSDCRQPRLTRIPP